MSVVYRRTRKAHPRRVVRRAPRRWVGTSPLRKSLIYRARHSRLRPTRLRRQPHRKWVGTHAKPPVLLNVTVFTGAPKKVFLRYDKPLNTASVPAVSDFVVHDGVTLMTVDLVQVSGYNIILTIH